MEKFLIVSPATFPAGIRLVLSQEQAEARIAALQEAGKGVYIATQPVQFKAGEVIGMSGEMPKALGELVVRPHAKRAAKHAAPEPEVSAPGESKDG